MRLSGVKPHGSLVGSCGASDQVRIPCSGKYDSLDSVGVGHYAWTLVSGWVLGMQAVVVGLCCKVQLACDMCCNDDHNF